MAEQTTYPLTQLEQDRADTLRAQIQADGGLFAYDLATAELKVDQHGVPIQVQLEPLHGRRLGPYHAMDGHGVIWRYAPRGSKKIPHRADGGGAPWRNNMVEMWGGLWRKIYETKPPRGQEPTGPSQYAKATIWCPVSPGVNEHPDITHMDWYQTEKGFKHPLSPPHTPDKTRVAIMEDQEHTLGEAIYAFTHEDPEIAQAAKEEGIEIGDVMAAPRTVAVIKPKARKRKAKKRPMRSNRPPEPVDVPVTETADVSA